ncbi:MAG: uroporphyrinogen-III synthase [Nitrosopumilus sp. B06]|nr:MAG: uroporphyrinogen-III synthase [Nitrosopumilus sp. D6]RNJ80320.1 MAG: uroporphyrinogen-III synthase [Nitrosopumilus sp. B06]
MAIKNIAITRASDDAAEFVSLARANDMHPITLPTIKLVGRGEKIVDEFLLDISEHDPDYTVFMSSKAVSILFDTAKQAKRYDELRLAVANTTVISVGPKTTQMLKSHGIRTNHQPETYSSVGVGEVFTRIHAAGKKAIIPRSGASTPFLKELLEKIGLGVIEVHLYDVCAFQDTTEWNEFRNLFSQKLIDSVIFTSASSVRAFLEIMSRDHKKDTLLAGLGGIFIISIGPFTAAELQRRGITHKMADVHTISGAFEAARQNLS